MASNPKCESSRTLTDGQRYSFRNREQFLRDGDQLAARLTGTITMGGNDIKFESFIIAEVDKESGKMLWLIERGVTIDQAST